MNTVLQDEALVNSIAFVGNTLGPFFVYDPKRDEAKLAPSAEAILALNVEEAGNEWPFVVESLAVNALGLMQKGLAAGLSDEALYREYRRLFVGPARKAAPPWGSVYTDRDQVIFGESTMEFRSWLRRNGVSVAVLGGDMPEDHIGIMLELMAWLAMNKPGLVEEFLQCHLLPWAAHFLDVMISETSHSFYLGLARLTKQSLCGIQETLGVEVVVSKFYR